MLNKEIINILIEKAIAVRNNSYCVYSNFAVGASCLGESGNIYVGTNIENISYPVGICAERSAFARGISDGEKKFSAVAIVGYAKNSDSKNFCTPCGMCRQFMSEFANEDFIVILVKDKTEYKILKLKDLLPLAFDIL